MQSELQAARLELDKLEATETSITEASQSYLKSFFQKRGLYLTEALLLVVAILLLSRFSYAGMDAQTATSNMELFAREVMPELKELGPRPRFVQVPDRPALDA